MQPPEVTRDVQWTGLVRQALRGFRDAHPGSGRDWDRAEQFYAERGYRPAWLHSPRREASLVLIDRMGAAEDDGLRSADYHPESWTDWLQLDGHESSGKSELQRAVADVQLSAALLRYAADLAYGAGDHEASARQIDLVKWLAQARDAASAREAIAAIEPRHREYRRLRNILRPYRQNQARGGWPQLPEGILLRRSDVAGARAGSNDQRRRRENARQRAVRILCERLAVTDDLRARARNGRSRRSATGEPEARGEAIELAVRRFQARHALVVDGIVGAPRLHAGSLTASPMHGANLE